MSLIYRVSSSVVNISSHYNIYADTIDLCVLMDAWYNMLATRYIDGLFRGLFRVLSIYRVVSCSWMRGITCCTCSDSIYWRHSKEPSKEPVNTSCVYMLYWRALSSSLSRALSSVVNISSLFECRQYIESLHVIRRIHEHAVMRSRVLSHTRTLSHNHAHGHWHGHAHINTGTDTGTDTDTHTHTHT